MGDEASRGMARRASRGTAHWAAHQAALRAEIVRVAQAMDRAGYCPSKSGNVSARLRGGDGGEDGSEDGFLVTPSGLPYARTTPDDLVHLMPDGRPAPDGAARDGAARVGGRAPSSEWPFHAAIYAARPDVAAIVHTHSPRATALACARRGLPAFHYMIALCGGADVRCAPYATFGSPELAAHAVAALDGRKAALLANHGVVAVGASLEGALTIAAEVENLAGEYLDLLAAGLEPVVLDAEEMARVSLKFAGYGKVG